MTTREFNSSANRELILSVTLLLLLAFCLAAKLGPPMEQRLVENGAGDDDAIARVNWSMIGIATLYAAAYAAAFLGIACFLFRRKPLNA